MHKHVKARKLNGRGTTGKAVVMGVLQRLGEGESLIRANVIRTPDKATVHDYVKANVEAGANLYTDSMLSYKGLEEAFVHDAVDHAVEYVRGQVHTNGLENFWSLLKRTLRGTYVAVNAEHLFRYLDEQSFRYNERKNEDGDKGRFLKAIAGMLGKRLTYAALIGGKDALPKAA